MPMETSTARCRSVRRKAATTLTEIPDHLLAEIFLRLPAAEDLARASAVCVSFGRLVKDKSFLRGFRRLHRRAATVLHSSTPMATSTARRRHGRKKTKTTLTEIPDHLLAEILLRLPAAGDLARVSAACVTFRRLVIDTDGSFLRRFRRLHDPPLLTFFDRDGFHHADPPHPSAPAACALASAADFSFSFFPNHGDWAVQDIRDGRVLLLRPGEDQQRQVSMELAVCDPLYRRYVLLPPLPDNLAASVAQAHPATAHKPWCEAFLVPLDEDAEAAFGVIWLVLSATRVASFIYSSTTGQWQTAASKEWNELFLERGESVMASPINRGFYRRHYAYGCFYWESTMMDKKGMLVLDTRRMEFSISDAPPRKLYIWALGLAIVEAGEGRLGMYGILKPSAGKFDLCYYIKGNTGESSSQWQLEKSISLGCGCQYDIKAAAGRYLLIGMFGALRFVGTTPQLPDREYMSVDVKTLQLERVCGKSSGFAHSKTWIYANFPPSLSSPTVYQQPSLSVPNKLG